MTYIVTHLTVRGKRFIMAKSHDTLEDAFEDIKDRLNAAIDHNAYVTVRVSKRSDP